MATQTSLTHLILGGARSGKSSFAEATGLELARQHPQALTYIATAEAGDAEMRARINQHQAQRHAVWRLIEEPIALASALRSIKQPSSIILIDCLTLWLSNCLHASPNSWAAEREDFLTALQDTEHTVLMVSNEVGHGITPMGELTRHYVDEIGWLHQSVARVCSHVTMVIAGLPQILKQPDQPR